MNTFAQAIEHAMDFIQSVDSVALLERDYKTQAAVVRCIEIIGEAANKIQQQAPEVIKAHPEIPWLQMRAMRNKMIHDYFDVEPGVVWSTVKDDLPLLKRQIYTLLNPMKSMPFRRFSSSSGVISIRSPFCDRAVGRNGREMFYSPSFLC